MRKIKCRKIKIYCKNEIFKKQRKRGFNWLKSTTVISPIDGIIANRVVEPGVYVKNGWPMMSVVPIEDVWVIVTLETQVKK